MTAVVALALPAAGQVRRTPDGKPNLNGIWQVLTTANWDLQGHAAAAGPMIPLGAVGAMPPGQGVVEGEEIPYKPEALATKKANFADRLKLDPEVKCYLPGVPRATYMPFPFQIVQTPKFILITTSTRTPRAPYIWKTQGRLPSIAGWDNRWAIGKATHWW